MTDTDRVRAHAWEPLEPSAAAELLAGLDAPWWIAGGYAIELFVGRALRVHEDLDVVVLRPALARVQAHLGAWDLHVADPPGTLRPWRRGEVLPAAAHDIWCRPSPDRAWALQLMVADVEGGRWVYRRDPSIRGPLASFGWRTAGGLPVLAPEVQLLYKAKRPRAKDEADFAAALLALRDAQRAWLERALERTAPGHPWRGAIRAVD